jgi:hypothetical protein
MERSRTAILLISGGADTISRPGASTLMGDLLIERLKRASYRRPLVRFGMTICSLRTSWCLLQL